MPDFYPMDNAQYCFLCRQPNNNILKQQTRFKRKEDKDKEEGSRSPTSSQLENLDGGNLLPGK